MASKIYFDDSMSGQNELLSFEWLKEKVFNGDDLLWEGATGICSLSYLTDGEFKIGMNLIGCEDYGFMVDIIIQTN